MKWTALLLVTAFLAGCTDDPHTHGEAFTCPDGTVLQPGNFTDHHNETFDLSVQCPVTEEVPPASAAVVDLPATTTTFRPLNFGWVLDTPEDEAHAMLTEVRVSSTSADTQDLAGPETFGTTVTKKEHQNFESGKRYDAEWTPNEPGTFYLRAYAEVFGSDIWSPEVAIEVNPVEPTGTTITITITEGGPLLAGADPSEVEATLGDAIVFQNDDLFAHSFTWTTAPMGLQDFAVAAGASSDPFILLVPGSYQYTSDDMQPVRGSINVA